MVDDMTLLNTCVVNLLRVTSSTTNTSQ